MGDYSQEKIRALIGQCQDQNLSTTARGLRDVQDCAGHKDPRTRRRFDHSRDSLDRNAAYTVLVRAPGILAGWNCIGEHRVGCGRRIGSDHR